MKGLLAKDLALMKQRGKMILFLIVWAIIMSAVMEDASFVVGWIVMIATISSVSTISYDEYDNCMPFLMSMPVTRRDYAVEKYLFSACIGFVFWLISLVIVACCSRFTDMKFSVSEDLPGMVLFLAVVLILLSVSIPPQLKWGAEKGRITMLIIFGVVFVGGFLISKLSAGMDTSGLKRFVSWLDTLPMAGVILVVLAVSVLITLVSVMISIRIMEKKEF